jgi:phosphoglycerate dehydrogenase-like enzyme
LSGVILTNVGRGDLIDQAALVAALESGQVSGYGADVLTDCSPSNPLLNRDNVLLTPHSAFYTANSLSNAGEIITANVEAWAAGHPINVVNA